VNDFVADRYVFVLLQTSLSDFVADECGCWWISFCGEKVANI